MNNKMIDINFETTDFLVDRYNTGMLLKRDLSDYFTTAGIREFISRGEYKAETFLSAITGPDENNPMAGHYQSFFNLIPEYEKKKITILEKLNSDEICSNLRQYMPPELSIPNVNINISLFDMDARMYEDVIIDFLYLKELSSAEISELIAHEMHHKIYWNLHSSVLDRVENENHATFLWYMMMIEMEAYADQIDKTFTGNDPDTGDSDYLYEYNHAGEILSEINNTIQCEPLCLINNGLNNLLKSKIQKSGHGIGSRIISELKKTKDRIFLNSKLLEPFGLLNAYHIHCLEEGKTGIGSILSLIEREDI